MLICNLYLYRAAIMRPAVELRSEILRTVNRAFDGALTPMMQFLIENESLSDEEYQELEAPRSATASAARPRTSERPRRSPRRRPPGPSEREDHERIRAMAEFGGPSLFILFAIRMLIQSSVLILLSCGSWTSFCGAGSGPWCGTGSGCWSWSSSFCRPRCRPRPV